MHIAAEVDQRLLHLLLTEKIAHAVSDIAFGDRPEIQLHPRLLEKHAAGCLIRITSCGRVSASRALISAASGTLCP